MEKINWIGALEVKGREFEKGKKLCEMSFSNAVLKVGCDLESFVPSALSPRRKVRRDREMAAAGA